MKCFSCGQPGHIARECPWADGITERALPQLARCGSCATLIYAWERNAPCGRHRAVAEWRAYYHSPQFAADAAAARERKVKDAPKDEDQLRALAARQVAEFRAERGIL